MPRSLRTWLERAKSSSSNSRYSEDSSTPFRSRVSSASDISYKPHKSITLPSATLSSSKGSIDGADDSNPPHISSPAKPQITLPRHSDVATALKPYCSKCRYRFCLPFYERWCREHFPSHSGKTTNLEWPYGHHKEQFPVVNGEKQRWRRVEKQYCPVCKIPKPKPHTVFGCNPAYEHIDEVSEEVNRLALDGLVTEMTGEEMQSLGVRRRERSSG